MALITCPECGKQISEKAEKCINCGAPLVQKAIPKIERTTHNNNTISEIKQTKSSKSRILFGSIILIGLAILGSGIYFIQKQRSSDLETQRSSAGTSTDLPNSFYKKLKGTIGENIPITMDLIKSDSILNGTYFYDKIKVPMSLEGKISSSFEIQLKEINDKSIVTGVFSGKFTAPNSFEGNWTSPQSGKSLPFKLTEITEGVASISFESFSKRNCLKAEKFKQKPSEITGEWDTVCSTLDLHLIKISSSNSNVSEVINNSLIQALSKENKSIDNYLNSFVTQVPEFYSKTEIIFSVPLNENNVLAISKLELTEDEGSAHPNHYTTYYNYDLLTGRQIKLQDILIPNFNSRLITIAEKMFIDQWGVEEEFDVNNLRLDDDYQIGMRGLWFHYIGAYIGADGVYIPYEKIDDLINPNGLLTRLYQHKSK